MSELVIIRPEAPSLRTCWNPAAPIASMWRHRHLISQFTRRELAERYRGSYFGVAWALLSPLLVLAIYTFVFNVVLKARWGGAAGGGTLEFALALFCGLVLYGVFSECATQAPAVIVNNRAYVKKTVFPLEVLPAVNLASALVRAAIGAGVLVAGIALFRGGVSWTLLLLPLPFVPLALIALGVGWFLAAFGVFVRDAQHTVALVVQLLFFMTPIVYPVSSVPERLRIVIYANPFTHMVEAARSAAMWGRTPDWPWLAASAAFSLFVFQAGYAFFTRSRRAFADVL